MRRTTLALALAASCLATLAQAQNPQGPGSGPNGPPPARGSQPRQRMMDGGPDGPPMGQGPMMRVPGPGPDVAGAFLAHTGDLKLTDVQVTRLAAISRRTSERRRAMRARLDSLRPAMTPGARPDSAGRAAMARRFEQLRPQMEQMRDQDRTDLRDALAVLTPDQLAQAWEMRDHDRGPRGGEGEGRPRMMRQRIRD